MNRSSICGMRCRTIIATAMLALTMLTINALNHKINDIAMTQPENTAKDVTVELETSLGNIKLLLYGDTPLHMNNFVKLVNEGYYDGLLFHRVINDFMIQGGDPNSKNAPAGKMLGDGSPDYKIDAEFVYPRHFHKHGALAAAREGDNVNPEKKSSGSQFYIVTGRKFSPAQLDQMQHQRLMMQKKSIFNDLTLQNRDSIMAMRRNHDAAGLQQLQEELIKQTEEMAAANPDTLTAEQRDAYVNLGGTPHLDGAYTVFGEVISGMDVVDKIQKVETDQNDRPKEDVRIIRAKIVK